MPRLATGFDAPSVARFADDARRLGIRAETLLLAVSGGPDSLAMLLLARAALGAGIAVATVDHGLRPAAAAEAASVATLSASLGVRHRTLRLDSGAAVRSGGVQAAARDGRYAALSAYAAECGRSAIATAHHADDQAETMLMRLMRGSGLPGLTGVRADRPLAPGIRLVRPLLGWTREELGAVVAGAGVAPVDDPSNRDPRFDRTAARALLAGVDPRPFAAAAANLADAEAALGWAVAGAAEARLVRTGAGWTLDHSDLPHEFLRRLTLAVLTDAGVAADGPALERLLARAAAGTTSTLGTVKLVPGRVWRFERVRPHRTPRPHGATDGAIGSAGAIVR